MNMDEKLHFADLSDRLLDWYASFGARFALADWAWRARAKGVTPDPYRVWLAEIMLQQTTVPHATRYYLEFTKRWPRIVEDLAAAEDETDVMAAWAGTWILCPRAKLAEVCA